MFSKTSMMQTTDESATLFVAALQPTATQAYVSTYFSNFGQVLSVNLRQNAHGECMGFGWVQMGSKLDVERVLTNNPHSFMGKMIDVKQFMKVTDEHKVFVGGLSPETTNQMLSSYFTQFGKVIDAAVRVNLATGRSRGFGIVTFAETNTAEHVLDIKDVVIDGKRVEVKRLSRNAIPHDKSNDDPMEEDSHPKALTNRLFVGGLHPQSDETSLQSFYSQFGELKSCVIGTDKATSKKRGFGFVQFKDADSVERCMAARPHVIDNKLVETKRALFNEDAKNMFTVPRLFVGGLKAQHNQDSLREYFNQFGNVMHVQMGKGDTPDQHKGYAFIVFDDYDPVDKVIVTKPHVIDGVRVDCAKGLNKDEMSKLEQQRQRDLHSREQRTIVNHGPMAFSFGGGASGGGMNLAGGNSGHASMSPGFQSSARSGAGYGHYPGMAMGGGPGMGGMNHGGAGMHHHQNQQNYHQQSSINYAGMGGSSSIKVLTGGGSNGGSMSMHPHPASKEMSGSRLRGHEFKQLLQSTEVSAEAIKTLENENLLDSSFVMALKTDEFMTLPLKMGDRKRIEYALKVLSEGAISY